MMFFFFVIEWMDLIQIFFSSFFCSMCVTITNSDNSFFCWNWNSWKLGMVLTIHKTWPYVTLFLSLCTKAINVSFISNLTHVHVPFMFVGSTGNENNCLSQVNFWFSSFFVFLLSRFRSHFMDPRLVIP